MFRDKMWKAQIKCMHMKPYCIDIMYVQNGASDVKSHRWFRRINWDDVYDRKLDVSSFHVHFRDCRITYCRLALYRVAQK